jgi:TolB-like protein/Tfp pilus assembly protein PilF
VAGWLLMRNGPEPDRADVRGATIPIAVLVFESQSTDDDAEVLSDGIADDINMKLSGTRGFLVKAHSSVRRLSRAEMEYSKIAERLNVEYLVHGSWRRTGDSIRVNVRLINPETEGQLWTGDYNLTYSAQNMFAVTGEVSRRVAGALSVVLSVAEQEILSAEHTLSTEAYSAYQHGKFFWNTRTEAGLLRALQHFEEAIALDSNYALAYVGLAETYALLAPYYVMHPNESFPAATEAAEKALQLDSTLGQAHAVLGWSELAFDWDWVSAEREFIRALELYDANATAHHWYAFYLMATRQFDDAVAQMNHALELDPLSPIITSQAGHPFYYARDYARAIEVYREALTLHPDFALAHRFLADAYIDSGMYTEGIASAQRAVSLVQSPPSTVYLWHLGYAYAKAGRIQDAHSVLGEIMRRMESEYVPPDLIAGLYAATGERDQALDWLDRAYAERCWSLIWLAVASEYDGLRSEPRFQDLLRGMQLPQVQ